MCVFTTFGKPEDKFKCNFKFKSSNLVHMYYKIGLIQQVLAGFISEQSIIIMHNLILVSHLEACD